MKINYFSFILYACLLTHKAGAQPVNTSFSQNIIYKQQLLGTNLGEVKKAWWHNRLEASVQYGFIRSFTDRVKQGQAITVYNPNPPFKEAMTFSEAQNSLLIRDSTVNMGDVEMGYTRVIMQTQDIGPEKIRSVMFNENWSFDAEKMTFEKTVKGITLTKSLPNAMGDLRESYVFYVPLNQAKDNSEKEKIPLLTGRITYDIRIKDLLGEPDTVNYAYTALVNGTTTEVNNADSVSLYDADGNETRHQIEVIDTIKYVDKNGYTIRVEKNRTDTVKYPNGLNRVNIQAILNSLYGPVIKGKLTAYDPVFPYNRALSKAEVKAIIARKDTVLQTNQWDKTKTDTFISTNKLTEDQVTSLRFYETWYYDHAREILYKKVNGVVLLKDIPGKTESQWAGKELFYIPLNEKKKEKAGKQTIPALSARLAYKIALDSVPYFRKTEGIDTGRYVSFINAVISGALAGYSYAGDAGYLVSMLPDMHEFRPLTSAELKDILNPVPDTVLISGFDKNGNETINPVVVQVHREAKDIRSLTFIEDWVFDAEKFQFNKTVRGIFPAIQKRNDIGEFIGFRPLFYFPFVPDLQISPAFGDPGSRYEIDYSPLVKPGNSLGKNVLYYVPVNTDDGYGDGMEVSAIPSWYENLEYSRREAIVKKLADLTLDGKITAYAPGTTSPLSIADFKKIMTKEIKENGKIIHSPMEYADVTSLGFEEEWYAGTDKPLFYKKVNKLYFATGANNSEIGAGKCTPLVYFIFK